MDLREFLNLLEKEGELVTIEEELDPKWDVSAVLKLLDKKESPAVLFIKVKGYDIPVVGNLMNGERKLALVLDTKREVLWDEYRKRLTKPISPVLVKKGAVQEVVVDEVDILRTIPVLTYHERDASPYITQGVTFIKDPETGRSSMGVHRLQVKSKNKLGFYLSHGSVTSRNLLEKAEKKGESLPVAIAIGVEPPILLAVHSIGLQPSLNKLELAGGLGGKPVEVVNAKTSDILVPANAMFIIEGEIPPGIREIDGPFGEVLGYYICGQGFVINVKTITHQSNPIYSVSQPFSSDDHIDAMMEMPLEELLRRMIPNLKSVAYNFPSSLLVVSIEKKNPWDSRHALYTCLNTVVLAKYIIIVDEDVDPHNLEDVGFALAGRCQPHSDVIIINDVLGFDLDPSLRDGSLTSKLGLDATKPLEKSESYEKVGVPKVSMDKASQILKKYLK